ncbi:hypothetical protein [Bacillus phage CM1]|nr:hypothetical protein [Bacillus phage CM1]
MNYDTNIMIPYEYVNYKEFLTDFTLLSTVDEYNNEILTYEVNKPVRKITRRTGVIVWSSNSKRSLITN